MRAHEFNQEKNTKETFKRMLTDFLLLASKFLKLESLPTFKFQDHITPHDQPSFGMYVNDEDTLYIALANRHPVDILRTIAHELVHYKQDQMNMLDHDSGDTGSPEENQANAIAGVIMRHFNKQHPEYLEMYPVLAETIRKVGSQYRLVSKSGKNLGTYPSRAGAVKREKQVSYFKHVKETNNTLNELDTETLRSYYHDAFNDIGRDIDSSTRARKNAIRSKNQNNFTDSDGWSDEEDFYLQHANKRAHGAARAALKLIKRGQGVEEGKIDEFAPPKDNGDSGNNWPYWLQQADASLQKLGFAKLKFMQDVGYVTKWQSPKESREYIDVVLVPFKQEPNKSESGVIKIQVTVVENNNIKQNNPVIKGIQPDDKTLKLMIFILSSIIESRLNPDSDEQGVAEAHRSGDFPGAPGVRMPGNRPPEFVKYSDLHGKLRDLWNIWITAGNGERIQFYKTREGLKQESDIIDEIQALVDEYPRLKGSSVPKKSSPPESVAENFADGKNPGRKGLSKRMGVPTKASVSKLRKIAKTSSGEKARMAHWLANMKSGRKK